MLWGLVSTSIINKWCILFTFKMPAVGKSILLDYMSLKPLWNAYKLYDFWQGVDLTLLSSYM